MQKFKLAIIGSRSINNIDYIYTFLDTVKDKIECIVSGGAKGPDKIAENWADLNNIPKIIYHAEWDNIDKSDAIIKINKYGKKYNANAGYERNTDIINTADLIVAFWDGKSKGTLDSIEKAKKMNKKIKVILL